MTLRLSVAQAARLGLPVQGMKAAPRRAQTGADSPQQKLQDMLTHRWPGEAQAEFVGAVPGRMYRLDVAFPAARLAVECDGWQFHGKHKSDFLRDRERDRQLVLNGWRILRFAASEIRRNPHGVLDQVSTALARAPLPAPV